MTDWVTGVLKTTKWLVSIALIMAMAMAAMETLLLRFYCATYRSGRWFVAITRFSTKAAAIDITTRSSGTVRSADETIKASNPICT